MEKEQVSYVYARLDRSGILAGLKRFLGFDAVDTVEVTEEDIEEWNRYGSWGENHDRRSRALTHAERRAEEKYGRNSPMHRAIGSYLFKDAFIRAGKIDELIESGCL
ncbi:hypothetical protein [Haloferax sp. Q22]|uniref:hypothetical protein n=1 Tax=Haloferax sp. (strain Q22) TaxID=1526048 RepID=UPI000737BC36|nr:hypothetical protein [Haloferax sp. Q22]